jgi:hypothetical protein
MTQQLKLKQSQKVKQVINMCYQSTNITVHIDTIFTHSIFTIILSFASGYSQSDISNTLRNLKSINFQMFSNILFGFSCLGGCDHLGWPLCRARSLRGVKSKHYFYNNYKIVRKDVRITQQVQTPIFARSKFRN